MSGSLLRPRLYVNFKDGLVGPGYLDTRANPAFTTSGNGKVNFVSSVRQTVPSPRWMVAGTWKETLKIDEPCLTWYGIAESKSSALTRLRLPKSNIVDSPQSHRCDGHLIRTAITTRRLSSSLLNVRPANLQNPRYLGSCSCRSHALPALLRLYLAEFAAISTCFESYYWSGGLRAPRTPRCAKRRF